VEQNIIFDVINTIPKVDAAIGLEIVFAKTNDYGKQMTLNLPMLRIQCPFFGTLFFDV
jgi:hypothetical protein